MNMLSAIFLSGWSWALYTVLSGRMSVSVMDVWVCSFKKFSPNRVLGVSNIRVDGGHGVPPCSAGCHFVKFKFGVRHNEGEQAKYREYPGLGRSQTSWPEWVPTILFLMKGHIIEREYLKSVPRVRIELTTLRLWDSRAAYCAIEACIRVGYHV